MLQPQWVTRECLRRERFDCCREPDLFPFKCVRCGQLLVFCEACEVIYTDLFDLARRQLPGLDDPACPACERSFAGNLYRDEPYRSEFAEWKAAGVSQLVRMPTSEHLTRLLIFSSTQLAHCLAGRMRSSATIRLTRFRNLAESVCEDASHATVVRTMGNEAAKSSSLEEALSWQASLGDPLARAFAVLGIADYVYPEES